MRRVVITGMGICSPLGNTLDDVSHNLRHGNSGASAAPAFAEHGFGCQIGMFVKDLPEVPTERTIQRAFGKGNLLKFAYYATYMALQDSGLTEEQIGKAGIIYGNGGPSTVDQVEAAMKTIDAGKPRINPMIVLPTMTSGPVAVLATAFKIKRMNFMVGAACATSAIAIGEAAEKILIGKADVMVAGGTESADWELAQGFDVMRAMCRDSNDYPEGASRPFDAKRSGFVLGEGAGTLVLEELEHAKARGARIYGELIGYGTSSDGKDLTNPDQDGAERSMREALEGYNGKVIPSSAVQYLNTHGTSTPNGDANELNSIIGVFGDRAPDFSSTKSMSGHSLGAAGAHEAIYCLLMMRDGFIAPTINVTDPDPLVHALFLETHLVTETLETNELDYVMSNSFGFGGVNATLLLARAT
ncbi:MAG: beta-ketoacyl-ACP synthase I [Alphaproteobacteria bacterium]|nr:MAG: beta-ketoacyl-ACP synthase I [Alphaproteobacteria bacterium]